MEVVKKFTKLTGTVCYYIEYSDGSNCEEEYEFKDFWELRYHLGEHFLENLKKELGYEDITLAGIYLHDKDRKFNILMYDNYIEANCQYQIDNDLIDENCKRKLDMFKNNVEQAKSYLDTIKY